MREAVEALAVALQQRFKAWRVGQAALRSPARHSLSLLLPASRSEARKMSGKLDEHYDKWSKIAADIEDDEPSPDPGTRPLPPAQTAPHAVASLCSACECARSRL